MKMSFRFLAKFLVIAFVAADTCDLPINLVDEIHGYQGVVDKIIEAVVDGKYSNRLYNDVADFVDTFGNRIAGKKDLAKKSKHIYTTDESQKATAIQSSLEVNLKRATFNYYCQRSNREVQQI